MRLKDKEKQDEFNKKERVRIANMVKRKPEIKKVCCICGKKDAEILHNKENPYLISFICRKCRLDDENMKVAEKHRFDLREVVDKSKLSTKNFTVKDMTIIVNDFLDDIISIGEYCKNIGISRYQFNKLVSRYADYFGDDIMEKRIMSHANTMNRKHLSKVFLEKNSFN